MRKEMHRLVLQASSAQSTIGPVIELTTAAARTATDGPAAAGPAAAGPAAASPTATASPATSA